MKKIYIYISFLSAMCWSCEQERIELKPSPRETPPVAEDPSSGEADFSKYVAVGSSFSAGFQAGALFDEGQANSLAAILANQFALAGGGEFNQPAINSINGFNSTFSDPANGVILGRLILAANTSEDPAATPAPTPTGLPDLPSPYNTADFPGPFTGNKADLNNFSVPGIIIGQALTPATGGPEDPANPAYNPYYARFASSPGASTLIGDAASAQGTFFSLWLGYNDVLGYAISGGTSEDIYTSEDDFEVQFGAALSTMTTDPAIEGVVGNIPNPVYAPYFHVINTSLADAGAQPFSLDATTAEQLNGLYQMFGYNSPEFTAGDNNYFVIQTGENTVKQMDPASDFLTLSFGTETGKLESEGLGTAGANGPNPIPDAFVLDGEEVASISGRTAAFNAIIATTISGLNLNERVALADVHGNLNTLIGAGAAFEDGVMLTPSFAPPFGMFSEDGVHPNSRGYAYIANIFIDAINETFDANVPRADIAVYPGTALPINY